MRRVNAVLIAVADVFGAPSPRDIFNRGGVHLTDLHWARLAAYHLIHETTGASQRAIADHVFRTNATVSKGIARANDLLAHNVAFAALYADAVERLREGAR